LDGADRLRGGKAILDRDARLPDNALAELPTPGTCVSEQSGSLSPMAARPGSLATPDVMAVDSCRGNAGLYDDAGLQGNATVLTVEASPDGGESALLCEASLLGDDGLSTDAFAGLSTTGTCVSKRSKTLSPTAARRCCVAPPDDTAVDACRGHASLSGDAGLRGEATMSGAAVLSGEASLVGDSGLLGEASSFSLPGDDGVAGLPTTVICPVEESLVLPPLLFRRFRFFTSSTGGVKIVVRRR